MITAPAISITIAIILSTMSFFANAMAVDDKGTKGDNGPNDKPAKLVPSTNNNDNKKYDTSSSSSHIIAHPPSGPCEASLSPQ